MNKTARLKKLSRHLLATTCLTFAAVGAARGATIVETPEPGGFGDSLSTATVIQGFTQGPGWTNIILGETAESISVDQSAYFILDMLPGSSFIYSFSVENSGTGSFQLTDTLGTNIGSTTPISFPVEGLSNYVTVTSGTGTAPAANGELVAAVLEDAGNESNRIYFNVTVTGDFVPEPGTATEIGLGLAGAAVVLRRRFNTRKA